MSNLQILFLLLTCTLVVNPIAAQTKSSPSVNEGPIVRDCIPHSGSVNSVIELTGFRVAPDELGSAKVLFIQNGIEIPADNLGGSAVTNDHLNGPQTLKVIVPQEVVPGAAQIVTERNGVRSAPVTFTITEWTPPVIKQIIPTTGPPGTTVAIECENLHTSDEIELTDSEGRRVKPKGGAGSTLGAAFTVPDDFPEGVLRIRIGNPKFGKYQFTPPVEFVVTNEALPLELVSDWMKSIAPGQWMDLQASSFAPLEHSEQTEVVFKQAGREIIVNAPHPQRPQVEVPAILSPGKVDLQVRTWRHGRPSLWSTPITLQLAEKAVPPCVQSLRLEKDTSWVNLSPGPDRATKFTAASGDLIVIHGSFPVVGADNLKVLLVRSGEVVELDVTALNGKADWFGDVSVRLPADTRRGDWQMIVRAVDGSEYVVPIPIRISAK